jgi:hypothetical protein
VTASLSRLQARHWLLVGLATLAAAVAGRPGPGGVLLGGAAIGASVLIYAAGFRIFLRGGGAQLAIGMLFVKLAAFLGLGWMLFTSGVRHRPDPIGFALGLTCFPAAAVWEAIRARRS